MVKRERKNKREGIKYFFLNGDHHRVLRISRAEDIVMAWNYNAGKRVTYPWSLTKKNMQKAFSIKEVCRIFQRDRLVIHDYIQQDKIKRPAQCYTIDSRRIPSKFLFSEDDMRELHSYLLTVHRGRPRNDGLITPSKLISRAELEAIMREERILYAKDGSGEYVPVWKQPDW